MFSIGLPAYKSKFLKQAIDSILNQSYKDFELIIVNDASPENVKDIVNSFNDNRIKYYENEFNYGKISVVKSWNKCLEYATGEYFIIFSDDDICDKQYLEEMRKLTLKYPETNLFHCRLATIDESNKILNVASICPEYERDFDFIWHRFKGIRLQAAPDFVIKTSELRKIGGFIDLPLAWGSDDLTWFKLAINKGVGYTYKVLVFWRQSEINISRIGCVDKRIEAIKEYDTWVNENIIKNKNFSENLFYKILVKDYKVWIDNMKKGLMYFAKIDFNNLLAIIKNYKYLNFSIIDLIKIIKSKIR